MLTGLRLVMAPRAGHVCGHWTALFLFLNKPKKELQSQDEPALHPIHCVAGSQEPLDEELATSRNHCANRYGMSRARVTQVMPPPKLPAEIQGRFLSLDSKKAVRRLFSPRPDCGACADVYLGISERCRAAHSARDLSLEFEIC